MWEKNVKLWWGIKQVIVFELCQICPDEIKGVSGRVDPPLHAAKKKHH